MCWQQNWCAFWNGYQSYSVASHSFWKKEVKFPRIGNAVMTDFHPIVTGPVKEYGTSEVERPVNCHNGLMSIQGPYQAGSHCQYPKLSLYPKPFSQVTVPVMRNEENWMPLCNRTQRPWKLQRKEELEGTEIAVEMITRYPDDKLSKELVTQEEHLQAGCKQRLGRDKEVPQPGSAYDKVHKFCSPSSSLGCHTALCVLDQGVEIHRGLSGFYSVDASRVLALNLFSCLHHEESGQQVEGGDPTPLLGPSEATSGVLCPVLGSSEKEGQETTGEGPVEVTKMIWGLEYLF
ncbi:hypothetical protein BTVI_05739 [Pitangus sulphuratus]|nr:hypothetical protein BTVI_05739 [Pitangus sulphuratus]